MRLAQWQDSFIQALRQGGSDEALLSLVKPGQASRLDIYRNNSLQALTATLSISFPISLQLVGEACFNQLATDYIQSNPMREMNLNHYGETFPAFLKQIIDTRIEFSRVKYLPQLADLEWSLQLSYYAADSLDCSPIASIAELTEAQHQDVVMLLRPDISIHHSTYPLFDIWHAHNQDEHVVIDKPQADYFFSVSRDPFKPLVKPLVAVDYHLLNAISAGASLGRMTELGIDMSPLPTWIAKAWICGFCLRDGQ